MASSTILSATFFGSTRNFPLSTPFLIALTRVVREAVLPLETGVLRSSLPRDRCANIERSPDRELCPATVCAL